MFSSAPKFCNEARVSTATYAVAFDRRPVTDGKCKKKAPRIIHKAEREKHKRDLLNDLFSELDEMLGELSRCACF